MFKIIWDKEKNGVILTINANGNALTVSPRPVFYEELDLLNFDQYWEYPKSKEPLLWAMDRRYYYKGEFVAEVNGGNIFDNAKITITDEGKGLKLKPINIEELVKANKDSLFLLEHEALQFISETYRTYSLKKIRRKALANEEIDWASLAESQEKKTKTKYAVVKEDCDSFDLMPLDLANEQNKTVYLDTKIEKFIVSFSGGKDSQVILDLVSRVLPPEEFVVIYSDTGLEIPPSLELYKQTEAHYKQLYPNLNFYLTKNPQDTVELWDKFGTPSRVHRWCCTVTKTAPLYRYLKEISGNDKQPNVLTFEGVRAEESSAREKYNRKIGKNVKHSGVINASPIFFWNATEVFLYLFTKNLHINDGYRKGLTRVGCCICPFSSDWSERIVNKVYPQTMKPFLEVIRNQVITSGVKDVDNYIKTGKWKIRAGGKTIDSLKSRIDILEQKTDLTVLLTNPKEELLEWLKVVGQLTYKIDGNKIQGEILTKDINCPFEAETLEKEPNYKIKVTFSNLYNYPLLLGRIKKVINKITYCTHCIACEIECPTGALIVEPIVKVDANKCIHCFKCVDFIDKGCVMAKSLNVTEGGINMSKKRGSINRYEGFGIKEEWLSSFFRYTNTFLETEHGLGGPQVRAFTNWLKDGELITTNITAISELTPIMQKIYPANPDLAWEILWVNFAYNSIIIDWYIQNAELGKKYERSELDAKLQNSYTEMQPRTLKNALDSVAYLFKYSKISNIKVGNNEKIGKETIITRLPHENVSPITLAYSLYRYAQKINRNNFTLGELYDEKQTNGLYKEFGISKERLENVLRGLQENKYNIIQVDLQMGLDNISLREDLAPIEILNILLEK